ncbi:MAG TPA: DUF5069 domain-containing protein [Nitrospira sp.]
MDLRTSFPRSMRVKLEGYVHLARMIDKCRAVLAGTEGEYIYPCPMDFRLLERAGISAEEFTAAVKANATDDGVAQWFRKTAKPYRPEEQNEWDEMMLTRGPSNPEKQAYFNKLRDAIDPSRTDLFAWSDLQDLEEGRIVPLRTAHR